MRKFLLFAIATMMSVAMMAAGGDGSSESKAIYFDWENGHEHVGTKWYRVDLSQIKGMVDPTLALYLTNLTDESVKVTMNEYVEISKFYGTPKSRSFVNGLLDKLVQQLANEGQINKEGKGLL